MPAINRRRFLGTTAMAALLPALGPSALAASVSARVIVDNDFAGDPDGLFALAHHLLSPSISLPLIVSSHLPVKFGGPHSAANGVKKVGELLSVMKRENAAPVLAGADLPITSRTQWKPSPATAAIIAEAMRTDSQAPLFYAAGAGLTELALAWLSEPKIGPRIKLVWIGGNEHPGLAYPPPGPAEVEFNLSLDPVAAQIIFNESDIEIWQIPRDVYRQMLFPTAEIEELGSASPTGRYLKAQLDEMEQNLAKIPGFRSMPISDVYVLGDSPLVTLTALMTPIQPDPASSRHIRKPTPLLMADGTYRERKDGRPMRVYTSIDSALTFRDMVIRLRR